MRSNSSDATETASRQAVRTGALISSKSTRINLLMPQTQYRGSRHHPANTRHVNERWEQRTEQSEFDPAEAWADGIRVSVPEIYSQEVRLYPPEDALLIRRDTALITVLKADYSRIDSPGMITCSHCTTVTTLVRSRGECEWCGEQLHAKRVDGRIQIEGMSAGKGGN